MSKRVPRYAKHFNEDGGWKNLKNTHSQDYRKLNDLVTDMLAGEFYYSLAGLRTIDAKKETEHLLQDTLLDIWRGIGTFDPSKGAVFTTWVYTIGINRLRKFLKKHKKSLESRLSDSDIEMDKHFVPVEFNELEKLLDDARTENVITPLQTTIIQDILDRKRSHEIGEIYNLSASSIRKIKREVIAKLRVWVHRIN